MPIVVVGVNHRTAPVGILERLAVSEERLPKALTQLANYEHIVEGVILSTCNRIEVYGVVSKFHAGAQELRNFLAEFCHAAPEEFVDLLYTYHDEGAVGHLFRVAGGVDSMIVGESEILGQVRRAYQAADDESMAQRLLGAAFRQALRVGKRARNETEIGRNPVSVSSAAVELARRAFDDKSLSGKRVAIVGAGKMGRLAARALAQAGATDVTIVNRSEERARAVAETFKTEPRGLDELPSVLVDSDIVICSTTAPETIIDETLAREAVAARAPSRPLFIVDIAVPRDVEPSVRDLAGVVLRDIDDLRGVVDSGIGRRISEVTKVETIISEELDRFVQWERATEIGPTIAALIARVEELRLQELDRVQGLSPEERAELDRTTKKVVARFLHEPLEKAKELAASKQGHLYLAALRELFELDDESSP